MKRIYHPYWLWEDFKHGFYDNCSGNVKSNYIEKILEMFNSEELTKEYMFRVITEWKYSCENNLTNEALNQIAYIGQSASCLYCGAPNSVTMEAWSLLDEKTQNQANKIAEKAIKRWKLNNKNIQLCLNLD